MAEGTIKKKTSRGFGFIRTNRGNDLYFDTSAVDETNDGTTFAQLREGQRVSYTVTESASGQRPRVDKVKPI